MCFRPPQFASFVVFENKQALECTLCYCIWLNYSAFQCHLVREHSRDVYEPDAQIVYKHLHCGGVCMSMDKIMLKP